MMTSQYAKWIGTVALVVGATGCAQQEEHEGESIASVQSPVTYVLTGDSLSATGFLLHVLGRGLNGVDLNGRILDGSQVTHLQLSSASYAGELMDGVVLSESKFRGRTADGKQLSNARFENVTFTAFTDAGNTIQIAVRGARRWTDKGMQDTFLYVAEYASSDGWLPLCGVDEHGEPVEAIALRGRWDYREGVAGGGDRIEDPDAFTFACRGHVAAKCLEMGYKPWRKALVCHVGEGCRMQPIGHLHQACTRMMRGDYCGDGTAHTIDGMAINAYDGYGIRDDSEAWEIEAEWSVDGALCLAQTRIEETALPCMESLTDATCGEAVHFVQGTALISEVPPEE